MNDPHSRQLRIPHPGWILLAGMLLAVSAIGLMVWNHPTLRLIREVKRLGGSVGTNPGGPDWLRELLGDDYGRIFDKVTSISVLGPKVTDDLLGGLNSLVLSLSLRTS